MGINSEYEKSLSLRTVPYRISPERSDWVRIRGSLLHVILLIFVNNYLWKWVQLILRVQRHRVLHRLIWSLYGLLMRLFLLSIHQTEHASRTIYTNIHETITYNNYIISIKQTIPHSKTSETLYSNTRFFQRGRTRKYCVGVSSTRCMCLVSL